MSSVPTKYSPFLLVLTGPKTFLMSAASKWTSTFGIGLPLLSSTFPRPWAAPRASARRAETRRGAAPTSGSAANRAVRECLIVSPPRRTQGPADSLSEGERILYPPPRGDQDD